MASPYIKPSEKISGSELQEILDLVWDDITEATKDQIIESLKENEIGVEV